jgi:6-phospho-beta-glucosidase
MAMTITFLGGGSPMNLPIVRSALAQRRILPGGEVRLVDKVLTRAEQVGRMIMRCPEYAGSDCRVTWSRNLDRALDGADVLYVTMSIGSLRHELACRHCQLKGFINSDQLSIAGAFKALMRGPLILDFARKMEKRCPGATMLIFCNPVAVYSGMVNNHTKIRAMGLCGGFINHRWDLTRLMGHDEYRDEYDVDVAGVNHLSFILRGTHRGRDLYKVLGRYLQNGWQPPRLPSMSRTGARQATYGLRKLAEMYHRFGRVIFSTEGDGMAHLFYEDMWKHDMGRRPPPSPATIRANHRAASNGAAKTSHPYDRYVDAPLDEKFWAQSSKAASQVGRKDEHIAVEVLKGLAGVGRRKIVTSFPNRGAVAGFKDRTVMEYSQYLDRRGLRPAGRLEIPDCLHGLISNLATHQTLLGDAIATRDPKVLADALFAYPVKQNTKDARELYKKVINMHEGEIPAAFQNAVNYL